MLWILYGTAAFIVGLRLRRAAVRYGALVLLAAAGAKILFVDAGYYDAPRDAALTALGTFAAATGMDDARLQAYEPAPGAHAYTAFMAWLALYGSEAEVAAGFLVNFAAWGATCGRMSRVPRIAER